MLRIDQLTKSFGSRVLFKDASYHFPQGERISLVGANGAGKTTLLNILCGLDHADGGEIQTPGTVTVGYLPQKPNEKPLATVLAECEAGATALAAAKQRMETALSALERGADEKASLAFEQAESAFRLAGGYALESKATSILSGLGFSPSQIMQNPLELSGGWRMRLELARLFIREPDFLILDEPTNHLDLPSLMWVENYLKAFRGTLLFVSHDRALLNRLATITLHLASGRLTPYRGNFDSFLEQREQRLEQDMAQRDQLRRRREQMQRFVERFGAKASKASQAQSRVKMIASIRELEEEIPAEDDEASVAIVIPDPPNVPRIVLRVEDGAIGYTAPLASGLELEVERAAKIAIIGANGIGKSTLLRTIAGRLPQLSGKFSLMNGVEVSYFAQEQTETLDPKKTVLANVMAQTTLSEREARSLLGSFLFRGDDVFKPLSVLSGGEASRVGLACALAQRAGLLLLDEPTNHLDMTSVEMLSASLADYAGTAVFVSHDRSFIDGVCTHVFAMLPDGRSMLFPGKLDDYARLAQLAGFPNVLAVESEATPSQVANKAAADVAKDPAKSSAGVSEAEIKDFKRERQKLQQRVDKLNGEMPKLKDALETLHAELSGLPPARHSEAAALYTKEQSLRDSLDALEMEWFEASERIETLTERLTALGRL